MTSREKKITRVSVSLEEGDYQRLLVIAERSDAFLAWVARRALADFLECDGGRHEGCSPIETADCNG